MGTFLRFNETLAPCSKIAISSNSRSFFNLFLVFLLACVGLYLAHMCFLVLYQSFLIVSSYQSFCICLSVALLQDQLLVLEWIWIKFSMHACPVHPTFVSCYPWPLFLTSTLPKQHGIVRQRTTATTWCFQGPAWSHSPADSSPLPGSTLGRSSARCGQTAR